MKRRSIFVIVLVLLCVAAVGTASAQANKPNATEVAVGTAFTYQGQIERNGTLFTGTCDMQISLWDDAAAGTQQGTTLNVNAVSVVNGVLAVTLDFGNQFKGEARWLQLEAKCADDADFMTLPRVELNPTPYAIGLMPGAVISGTGPLGVMIDTPNGNAIVAYGKSNGYATIYGSDDSLNGGYAVYGVSTKGVGVFGHSSQSYGVRGESISSTGAGVIGVGKCVNVGGSCVGGSANAPGVVGLAEASGVGVWGESTNFEGVRGTSHDANHGGVVGVNDAAGGIAVYGIAPNGGYAAWFNGRTKTNVVEITGGSDLAERFATADNTKVKPGTVMVIDEDHPGKLKVSDGAYDGKVIGIVSGAGGINTGLTLHQDGALEGDLIVAIAGRVYCKAEAHAAPIKPGDLLTTSSVAGHCMKVTDRDLAYGAVIGKALTGLVKGEGLVLVIVNLQ